MFYLHSRSKASTSTRAVWQSAAQRLGLMYYPPFLIDTRLHRIEGVVEEMHIIITALIAPQGKYTQPTPTTRYAIRTIHNRPTSYCAGMETAFQQMRCSRFYTQSNWIIVEFEQIESKRETIIATTRTLLRFLREPLPQAPLG